jgi:acyl-CoA thioesterase
MNVFEQYYELSGLDFLRQQIVTGDQSPMAQLFGMRIVEADDGRTVIEAQPTSNYYNPMGRVHGGFAATVLDSALGSSIMTKMGAGVGFGTVNLSINYVRKIDAETGILRAEGRVLHQGRTMLTAEAKLADMAGKLYAHANGTFLVYPKQS